MVNIMDEISKDLGCHGGECWIQRRVGLPRLGVCLVGHSVIGGFGWMGIECAVAQKTCLLVEAG